MDCARPLLHEAIGCDCPAPTERELLVAWIARDPRRARDLIRGERARRSLAEFFHQAFTEAIEPSTPYEHGPHVDAICDHVQWQLEERARAVADRGYMPACPDLLINMPPRALKTIIIQVAAVAWAWLHWPELRILCLSTNPKVSTEAADQCRALIRSEWYQNTFQPGWQIRDDKDGVTDMKNTVGGRRAARGLDANFVGEGGDWRIVDDPNDPDDVYSEVKRQGVERRWRNSIANRKTDPRTTITTGIQQRTHVDDWSAARILEGWIVLKLRQEFDPKHRWVTPMPVGNDNRLARAGGHAAAHRWQDWRTTEGETLHPRFTPAWCASEKAPTKLGVLGFSAQHNQEPRLLEGGLFKRAHWRFFRFQGSPPVELSTRPQGCNHAAALEIKLSDFQWVASSIDATFGKSDSSDFVGALLIAGIGSRVFVFGDLTARRNFPETLTMIKGVAADYPFAAHLIEKKANGQAIIDTLDGIVAGMIPVEPEGGKESRAQACAPRQLAGDVYLLDGAAWLDDFVSELADFPDGKHDDRVDALTQALIHYATARSAFWYA